MATEAQIRANQQNAQKSTGPKTDAGKAKSAQNARTHNLCAKTMIFTSPDVEKLFYERCQEISNQYPFEHALKEHLVMTLATAEFQIRLINRIKRGAAFHIMGITCDQLWGKQPFPTDPADRYEIETQILGATYLRDASDCNTLFKFNRYEVEQHRIWHRAMNDLEKLWDKHKETALEPSASADGQPVPETNPIPTNSAQSKAVTPQPTEPEPEAKSKAKEELPSSDASKDDPLLPPAA